MILNFVGKLASLFSFRTTLKSILNIRNSLIYRKYLTDFPFYSIIRRWVSKIERNFTIFSINLSICLHNQFRKWNIVEFIKINSIIFSYWFPYRFSETFTLHFLSNIALYIEWPKYIWVGETHVHLSKNPFHSL